jgi:hypothetical protein
LPAKLCDIGIAGFQDLVNFGDVQERQQQMFHRHEFMAALTSILKRFVETKFQFAT